MTKRNEPAAPLRLMLERFDELEDPRVNRGRLHSLENILVMSICAAICGADGWDEIANFAEGNEEWFAEFMEMPSGTPSADTFRRVFEALDPVVFERAFRSWVAELGRGFEGEVIAIDGKSVKRAINRARPTVPLHLLHVWATEQGLLLAQKSVAGAPGEVRGVADVLRELDVRGAIITADANSCTAATTHAVRERDAHYVLALKGNRAKLHALVREEFSNAAATGFSDVPSSTEETKAHGRREIRTVRALALEDWSIARGWRDLRTAVMVERTREVNGKASFEQKFYVSSLPPDAALLAKSIRSHWAVENGLHWTLDVTFREDHRRIRDLRSAENLGTVSRHALTLLKRTSARRKDMSIAQKRKMAGWNKGFLARVLLSGFVAN